MTDVQAQKLRATDDSLHPTPSSDEHEEGRVNVGQSLPVDYTVTGKLRLLEEGAPMIIDRFRRNGTEKQGVMTTSTVDSIQQSSDGKIVRTQNSIYRVSEI